ncbi:MAG: hypothetical protein KA184_11790 [Candidatus Hydrogenedentes bacterium]|nr:hypothetical protein [Candidatus Hydrogenedentota bacterium]
MNDQGGVAMRNAALAEIEVARAEELLAARRVFLQRLLEEGRPLPVEVVRDQGTPVRPGTLGGVPGPLAKAGIISLSGFSRALTPSRRGAWVALWRLEDAEAARGWLRENPDPRPKQGELFEGLERGPHGTAGA